MVTPDNLYTDAMCLKCERWTKIATHALDARRTPQAWCLQCREYTRHSVNTVHTPQIAVRRVERVHVMQVSPDNAKDVCDWISAIGGANGVDYDPGYVYEGDNVLVSVMVKWGGTETAETGWWISYQPSEQCFEVLNNETFTSRYEILVRS